MNKEKILDTLAQIILNTTFITVTLGFLSLIGYVIYLDWKISLSIFGFICIFGVICWSANRVDRKNWKID